MSCKVCNTNDHVKPHFGAEACAACAAFFRRTVAESKTFRCQRGQKCSVDEAVRNVCRACRFAKCLKVGMVAAEVQPKRDNPSRELQKRKTAASGIEDKSVTVLPIHVDVGTSYQPADQATNSSKPERIYSLEERNHRPGYLLDEVIESYHKLLDRRKFIHSDLLSLKSFFSNEQQIPTYTQPSKVTKETEQQLRKREMALVADFMQSLRPFSHFSPDDKYTLFKRFAMQFYFLESCYRTYLNNGFQTNSFTLPTCEKVDLNNTEQYFARFATNTMDAAAINQAYKWMLIEGMRDIVGPMTVMEMTEREMLAFNLILLYNKQNTIELGFDQQSILMKAKDELLDDLHNYYCDNNTAEGEIRLGSLILLISAVQDWTYKKKEQFELIRFFDFNDRDEKWSELLDLN